MALVLGKPEMAGAEPISVIDPNNPDRQAACSRAETMRQLRECIYQEANSNWAIQIYESGGIPGTPGADIFVPKALEVLQDIVDRCELGATFYVRATDGVAHLYVGHPDLTTEQMDCIRTAERPGLRLKKSDQ